MCQPIRPALLRKPAPLRTLSLWVSPICAKLFYRYYCGNRHYSTGTTEGPLMYIYIYMHIYQVYVYAHSLSGKRFRIPLSFSRTTRIAGHTRLSLFCPPWLAYSSNVRPACNTYLFALRAADVGAVLLFVVDGGACLFVRPAKK